MSNVLDTVKPGTVFRVPRYDCEWTVLYYHRGGNYVCRESVHDTTCHFHVSEILSPVEEIIGIDTVSFSV